MGETRELDESDFVTTPAKPQSGLEFTRVECLFMRLTPNTIGSRFLLLVHCETENESDH